ncbi:MAG: hypothetical protein NT154_17985 [Verrucomicrobia bacterium]|jgi:hypothetical protein|nr:hypothetical protein [Verrucomicrobiota bacterium]
MILPTKHINPLDSLLGVGALILERLKTTKTVTQLWDEMRDSPQVVTFERLVLGLDLLYMMGLVELDGGVIRRAGQ